MTETGAKPARSGLIRFLLVAGLSGLLLIGGLLWYVRTDAFQAMVRRRLVTELEKVTGGRVELGSFHVVPFHFQLEVRDLTIHGREAPGEVPYAHAERLIAEVKIISVLGAEFGFHALVLDHPTIHLIFYPDGTSNQPQPKVRESRGAPPIQQLFALSITRLEVRHGELIWNDQTVPFDFSANEVSADMSYSILHRRYDGNLLLGKVDTRIEGCRPFAWTTEAHYALSEDSLRILSLKATSGRSRLEANGDVRHFSQPKVEGSYKATVDLAEVAAILRQPEVRRGLLQADGQGVWSLQEFSSVGNLIAKDADWHDENFNVTGVNATASYSINPRKLSIAKIVGRALDGSVTGEIEVENWLKSSPSSAPKLAKAKFSEEEKGSVQLRVKDLSVASFDTFVSSSAFPLNRMNFGGSLAGTLDYRWRDTTKNAQANVVLDVVPARQPRPGQLPLTAHAAGLYQQGSRELQITELNASTASTQVHAAGTLSSTAALRVSFTTSDLNEWRPLFAAKQFSGHLPITLHGHGSFNGTLSGRIPDVALAGSVDARDFDILIPATSRKPEQSIHWDTLNANVQLSRRQLLVRSATLHRDDASIALDLAADLGKGDFTPGSSFTAHADVENVDIAEMLDLAGYDYPVTGNANLTISAAGTRNDPHAEGSVRISDATIRGESVERLDARFALAGEEIKLTNIRLAQEDARITGDGSYAFNSRSFTANLVGANFDLAKIPQVQMGRIAVSGRLDFTTQSHGSLESPQINATVHLRDLAFDHERAGDLTVNAVTQGSDLLLNGSSQFLDAQLRLEGKVQPKGKWPADLNLHFDHLDVDSLLKAYIPKGVIGHSALAGALHLEGPLRDLHSLTVTADLSDLNAEVEGIKLRNSGPLRFSISKEVLRLEQVRIVGEGTDLSADGTIGLSGAHDLAVRARGTANLHLIQTYNPDFTASGLVAVDTTISGTATAPAIQGRLQITNGAIAYIDLPSALANINGTLVFNQDRLQIESVTAHTGGGQVTLSGYLTSYNRQLNFNVTLHQEEVRFRYPPGVSSTSSADLHFVGSPSASTLSGDVLITKLGVTTGFDFGAYLARSAQASSLPQTNPLLNRIRLDVHIVTTPELQMQTADIRLSADADLRLRGTAAKPVLLGRADVIEGEAYFNGTKYRLERGGVSFTSPVTTTPVLDLQATTRVRDYDITLNVTGEVDKLNIIYRSEPPLPTADIISLLALGRTREESAQLGSSGSAFSQEASNAILSEALNATVSSRMQKLFGVSRVKIDPQGQATETSTTARGPQVTIEQQVANNLTVTYSTTVNQASQQIIQVEYNLTRNVSIVGLRDQNGVISFDIKLRRRKK